jgi:hypothetical protein
MKNTDSDLQKSVGTNPFVNANKLLEKDRYFLNHHNNRDQYKNTSQEAVKLMDIPVQDTYLCEEPCRSDMYNRYCYVEAMLKKCIVSNISYKMEIKDKDKDKDKPKKSKTKYNKTYSCNPSNEEDQAETVTLLPRKHKGKQGQKFKIEQFPPLLFRNRGNKGREYFNRDRVYNGEMVRRQAMIRWDKKLGKQQELKPPMRTDDARLFNTFILHRDYKNEIDYLVDYFSREEARWIEVIGSGGSPSKMDKNGADWDSILKDKQDIAHIAHCQYLNEMNSTIINGAQCNRPVAVFIGKEVYDKIWSDERLVNMKQSGKMVNFSKDDLYFLGYFKTIRQYSEEGMTHDELKEKYINNTRGYIDQQTLHRFREEPYFRLQLELIPDVLLEILPVWSETGSKDGKGGLVHHGGQLRELNVDYDPHERIRYPVQRENLSKHLSLGIVKRCKDKTSIACEDAAVSEAVIEDNEECIDTIGRETLLNSHLEKEVRWNSVECRNVKTTSVLVERDQLPKPIFQKVFSRGYTNEDHSYKLKTEQ